MANFASAKIAETPDIVRFRKPHVNCRIPETLTLFIFQHTIGGVYNAKRFNCVPNPTYSGYCGPGGPGGVHISERISPNNPHAEAFVLSPYSSYEGGK